MDTFLVHAHSGLRWICLLLLLASIFMAFGGKNKPFDGGNRKIYLFALISLHLQVVLGVILYFTSVKVATGMELPNPMEMPQRYWLVEHGVGMVIGAVLVTMGWSRAKRKTEDAAKHKQVAIFYLIGTLIILATIPWPFRENLGGGLI